MKNLSKPLCALLCALSLGAASATAQPAQESGVAHVVLIWLKQANNPAHRRQVIAASEKLRAIPGVLDLRVGEVIASDRPLVEDSYDVGLYLRFASRADLQAYLAHPLHQETIRSILPPIVDRYRVHDFSVQTGGE